MKHQIGRADAFRLPLLDQSIDTAVTDPPWSFDLRVSPNAKSVRATDYPLLSDGSMVLAFQEIYRVLRPGGHCYIFVPERKLEAALSLACSSNFKHFNTIIWVKVRKDGTDLRIGLGHTYRAAWEAILCLSKEHRQPLTAKNFPNVLFAPPIGGSRKPPELYRQLVGASTKPGGVVLDPFCGGDPLGRAGLSDYQTISFDRYNLESTERSDGGDR